MRQELEQEVDDVDKKQNLAELTPEKISVSNEPTTLVPRLIFRDWASASATSLKEAWNAV